MCMVFDNKSLVCKLLAFTFFTTFRVYLDHSLARKNMEQSRLCPANSWILYSLPVQ